MSAWTQIGIWIVGIIGSGTINLVIIGIYIGRYQGDLRNCKHRLHEMEDEKKSDRELLTNIRERLRWCESKLNGVNWRRES
jgi:hypothetical protein